MKAISLDAETASLDRILAEAAGGAIVFLTRQGETRFVVAPADDFDHEVCALRANAEFMTYLALAEDRARAGPRKSLDEIRRLYEKSAEDETDFCSGQ